MIYTNKNLPLPAGFFVSAKHEISQKQQSNGIDNDRNDEQFVVFTVFRRQLACLQCGNLIINQYFLRRYMFIYHAIQLSLKTYLQFLFLINR